MLRPPLPSARRAQPAPPPQQPPAKRPRASPTTDLERKLYDAVRSKADAGIWVADLRRDTGTSPPVAAKVLNSLVSKGLIKEVTDIKNPSRKTYMASDFRPSKEMSGGSWYVNGSLDTDLVAQLRQVSLHCIRQNSVATVDAILSLISRAGAFKVEVSEESLVEILGTMVLDREIEECVSSGVGEFAFVQKGRTCYRVAKGRAPGEAAVGGLAAVPCGVCPRIQDCTPDGVISPATCVYFDRWFDF